MQVNNALLLHIKNICPGSKPTQRNVSVYCRGRNDRSLHDMHVIFKDIHVTYTFSEEGREKMTDVLAVLFAKLELEYKRINNGI